MTTNGFMRGGFGGIDPIQVFKQQQQERRSRGKNVHIKVPLTLEECYNGCSKEVEYAIQKLCGGCSGNGAKDGRAIHTCSACG